MLSDIRITWSVVDNKLIVLILIEKEAVEIND